MSRDVIAYIDKAALLYNFHFLRQRFPRSSILAMIKSNGYGHGLLSVAETLSEANALGVACLEEALALREHGIQAPIVVMSGFIDKQELQFFSQYNMTPVIHQLSQIELLEKTTLPKSLSAWLKIDTGMHRLGFPKERFQEVYQRLLKLASLQNSFGIMTHLASADQSPAFTERQIHEFLQLTQSFTNPKSIANSAGILRYPEAHCDWIRPGILLYGVSPFADRTGQDEGLKPVMTLQAKLIVCKTVKKHGTVGYGCTWQAPEDMPVGVVAIGYGDGYPRSAVSGTPVLLHDTICPLIGTVSMDMITIDLRLCPYAKPGDRVTLWGGGLPVEHIAKSAGTIAYELLCHVTQRVKFTEYH
ncbi:MAG: alanine racemase [Coxiella sp. RIFCSPHIGHO2_12_FULL_42_15]|nr:MAG: alanine racemase [Coxiella sp. RIFCSPHIGHO2_12_FULL_42_15]